MNNYRKYYQEITNRELPDGFEVHHINSNTSDNRIDNLVALPIKLHKKYHSLLRLLYNSNSINIENNYILSLDFKIKGICDNGNKSLDFTIEILNEISEIIYLCSRWIDYRDFFLGRIKNIHEINYNIL